MSDIDKCDGRSVACPPLSSRLYCTPRILQFGNTVAKYIWEIQLQNTFGKYSYKIHYTILPNKKCLPTLDPAPVMPCIFHILHSTFHVSLCVKNVSREFAVECSSSMSMLPLCSALAPTIRHSPASFFDVYVSVHIYVQCTYIYIYVHCTRVHMYAYMSRYLYVRHTLYISALAQFTNGKWINGGLPE